MDLQNTKTSLIEWLQQLQDRSLLKELETVAKSHTRGDWWDALPNEAKDSIPRGNQGYLEGWGISHEEAKKRFSERFGL